MPIMNPFTVYIDPASIQPSGEDMEWCIISEMMKRAEYERKYPDDQETEWREGAAGDEFKDWETKEQIRLAEYFRISKKKDTLLKLARGSSSYESDYDESRLGAIARDLRGREIARPT